MKSSKMLVAAGLGLVIVAFGAGYAFKDRRSGVDNSPSPTPTATPLVSAPARKPLNHSVRLTISGPVPKTLTVFAGDSVTFTNETQTEYWPASQPHPAHDMCPGFDARRGLKLGDTYALTFTTQRTCDYYNNLAPQNSAQKGSIVVR